MDKDAIFKEVQKIQKAANKKYGKDLFVEQEKNKEIVFVMKKAAEDESLPMWKRNYYRARVKDFEGTETVLNEEVAQKMDKYVQKQINKAIKDGRLPAKDSKEYVSTVPSTKTN